MGNDLDKIVSMIIQSLRISKHTQIIDLIKKSDYRLEWRDHDNWKNGIDFYNLIFFINFNDYSQIYDNKETFQQIIENALSSFYSSDSDVIQHVYFSTKIEHYIDWEALEASETKDSILLKLENEKAYLIQIATGVKRIQDINEQYKTLHQKLCKLLKTICLSNPNTYDDLWDWHNDYKERDLDSYDSRRKFVNNLFSEIISTITNSNIQNSFTVTYIPIGWENVDQSVSHMKENLVTASITEDYQAVGMYGREVLITLAQLVFDKEKYPSADGTDIGKADSKRMLEAYINYYIKSQKNTREYQFAKAAIDFSNELTHNRTATSLDAELCYIAVTTTVNIIRTIKNQMDFI